MLTASPSWPAECGEPLYLRGLETGGRVHPAEAQLLGGRGRRRSRLKHQQHSKYRYDYQTVDSLYHHFLLLKTFFNKV